MGVASKINTWVNQWSSHLVHSFLQISSGAISLTNVTLDLSHKLELGGGGYLEYASLNMTCKDAHLLCGH